MTNILTLGAITICGVTGSPSAGTGMFQMPRSSFAPRCQAQKASGRFFSTTAGSAARAPCATNSLTRSRTSISPLNGQ